MKREWFVEEDKRSQVALFLKIDDGSKIRVSEFVKETEDLRRELEAIKKGIDKALKEYENKLLSQKEKKQLKPEDIWKKMSEMNPDEMRDFFNSLPEETRRQVADFVFSHVNMFSGPGPIFAESYDPSTALMID